MDGPKPMRANHHATTHVNAMALLPSIKPIRSIILTHSKKKKKNNLFALALYYVACEEPQHKDGNKIHPEKGIKRPPDQIEHEC